MPALAAAEERGVALISPWKGQRLEAKLTKLGRKGTTCHGDGNHGVMSGALELHFRLVLRLMPMAPLLLVLLDACRVSGKTANHWAQFLD